MSFPRYAKYKSTGVDWLSNVPFHWTLPKLKHFASFKGGGTPSRDNLAYWGGSIPWVSPKDMKVEVLTEAEESITEAGLENSSSGRVPAGRVLLVVRSGILKHTIPVAINVVEVALNQDMKALEFDTERCAPAFFLRWVQGLNASLLLAWAKQGATVESLEHCYLQETVVPLPPLHDQLTIVDFLDRETAKIDALIEEQKRLIELLREKRQAVISQAVTKGLDPNVPMKDSGVEWLGEVPAHWEVKAIKRLSPVLRGASPRPIDDPKYFDDDGEYAWVRIADASASDGVLKETTQRLSTFGSALSVKLQPGSLFVSIAGTVGKPCIAGIKCCIHDGFVYFPRLRIDPMFLFRLFESGACYAGLGKMGTQLNLNTDTIGSIRVGLPPPEELSAIIVFIDSETKRFDQFIAEANSAMLLLIERRSAIISAAVTGKIKVPDTTKEEHP